jgi:hypothetical protein
VIKYLLKKDPAYLLIDISSWLSLLTNSAATKQAIEITCSNFRLFDSQHRWCVWLDGWMDDGWMDGWLDGRFKKMRILQDILGEG